MTSDQSAIRSIRTERVLELLQWCGDYHRRNKYPWSAFVRSTIGIYQVWQGMEWRIGKACKKPDLNAYEGFTAAAVHFMITAAALDLPLEQVLPETITDGWFAVGYEPERILFYFSRASQMLFYQMHVKNVVTKRGSSRYNPVRLNLDLACLIRYLLGSVPSASRAETIEISTHIMSERL